MSNPPAFQLYAADFYMDTISWSSENVGVYLRLLLCQWINGPLDFNAKKLAKIGQISDKKWAKSWQIVGEKFALNGNKKLINERLEQVRQEQLIYRENQSESGKRGVEVKKKKGIFPFDKSSDPSTNPSSDPATGNQTLQSSSSLKENYIKESKEIIDYLNKVGNRNFTHSKTHITVITARLKEGHTIEEGKKVIDTKWNDVGFDKKYFRPSTLFSPSKFEGYLNEDTKPEQVWG